MQDRGLAELYVEVLTGDKDTPMHWTALWGVKEEKRPAKCISFSSLGEVWDNLVKVNKEGYGVYCVVNKTDGEGAKGANVTGLRALFIDCDAGEPDESLFHEDFLPSFFVNCRRGPHYYWLLNRNCALESFTPAQKVLITHFNSDPAIHNLSRLMRVPGFVHPLSGELVDMMIQGWDRLFVGDAVKAHAPATPSRSEATETRSAPVAESAKPNTDDALAYCKACPVSVDGNGGNMRCYVVGAKMRDFGLSESAACEVMLEHFNPRCLPPWDEGELEEIIKHVYLYATGDAGSSGQKRVFMLGDEAEVASVYAETLGPNAVAADANVWTYDEDSGVYKPVSSSKIVSDVSSYSGSEVMGGARTKTLKISHSFATGVSRLLRSRLDVPEFFTDSPGGIVCKDGFVEVLSDGSLRVSEPGPHRRARARFDYSVTGKPHALWGEFLDQALGGEDDSRQRIEALQEFVGACVFGIATKYARSVILYGSGGSGKGTCLHAIKGIFPKELVSSLHPSKFKEPVFACSIVGTLLNVVDDIPSTKLERGGDFKSAVTGDELMAKALWHMPTAFSPVAGHIFSSNSLPEAGDASSGMWRRLLILKFVQSFHAQGKEDVGLREKLGASGVRSTIFRWAVEGAKRLVRENRYTIPDSHNEYLGMMKERSSSILDFFEAEGLEIIPEIEWKAAGQKCCELGMKVNSLHKMHGSYIEQETGRLPNIRKGEFLGELLGICQVGKDYDNHPLYAGVRQKLWN